LYNIFNASNKVKSLVRESDSVKIPVLSMLKMGLSFKSVFDLNTDVEVALSYLTSDGVLHQLFDDKLTLLRGEEMPLNDIIIKYIGKNEDLFRAKLKRDYYNFKFSHLLIDVIHKPGVVIDMKMGIVNFGKEVKLNSISDFFSEQNVEEVVKVNLNLVVDALERTFPFTSYVQYCMGLLLPDSKGDLRVVAAHSVKLVDVKRNKPYLATYRYQSTDPLDAIRLETNCFCCTNYTLRYLDVRVGDDISCRCEYTVNLSKFLMDKYYSSYWYRDRDCDGIIKVRGENTLYKLGDVIDGNIRLIDNNKLSEDEILFDTFDISSASCLSYLKFRGRVRSSDINSEQLKFSSLNVSHLIFERFKGGDVIYS